MKVYFAGISTSPELHEVNAENVLESYLYLKKKPDKLDFFKEHYKDIFLDSGAFTAFTQGEVIDIDEYINYIKKNKDSFQVYANLDVIGDSEATYKNWMYMKSKGTDPLPVIHYGSDKKYFDLYFKKHKVDYLALGGLVPYTRRRTDLKKWLDHCFSLIKEYWPVKIHLFGVTTPWVLRNYPAYSCDSTGWLYAGKRGRNVIFKNNSLYLSQVNDYLRTKNYKENNKKAAIEFMKFEKYLTELWTSRGITF